MSARFQNSGFQSTTFKNIATALVAALLFAGFVGWAVVTDDNTSDDRLATVATTTTGVTLPRVTTSTTSFVPPTSPTTFAPFAPNTTARPTITTRRTATTARSAAPTRRTTTTATTVAAGPNGRVTESSDNSAAFVHNSDGSTSESATAMPADPGALSFKLTTKVLSASGTSAQVRFTVELTNRRGRQITFPGGLRINLAITPSEAPPFTFVIDAREVVSMQNGETVTAVSTTPIEGYGTFNVTGSCEVDYGS